MENELRQENMKANIEFVMSTYNIKNYTELARTIGVAPTTWHSFQSNLTSNSSAKTAFCNHFHITVKQFEEERLSELDLLSGTDDSDSEARESPILSLSEEEIFTKLIVSSESPANDDSLSDIKKRIIEKNGMHFKTTISKARCEFKRKNSLDSLIAYRAAWAILTADNLAVVLESDLHNFISLCKQLNDEKSLNALIDKILTIELFNKKFILVLSILLEEDYPELAKLCLNSLLDE